MSEKRVENAVGELAAALYALAQKDGQAAFDAAGAAGSILTGMRMDLLRAGRAKP